jgi:hypothetical protein
MPNLNVRPTWKNQMMDPSGLHPGRFLWEVGKNYKSLILVTSNAYPDKQGSLKFNYINWNRTPVSDNYIFSFHCCDKGLIPYEDGTWNENNRMIKAFKLPLMKWQLTRLLALVKRSHHLEN